MDSFILLENEANIKTALASRFQKAEEVFAIMKPNSNGKNVQINKLLDFSEFDNWGKKRFVIIFIKVQQTLINAHR